MPLPCGVLYAFLLFVQVFPRPPPLQICGGALLSYVTRSQRFRQSASRWGCFFCSFLMLLLCIFHNFLSAFLLVFFCVFVMCPLFWCVHYGETGSRPAGRGDCGDDNCVVETKAARLSLKGSSSHLGRKKEKCANEFSGVHIY